MLWTTNEYRQQILAIPRSTLRAWIWVVTHEAQSVEDLSQDVYAELLEVNEAEIANIKSVQAYARTVCRNRALNWLRTRNYRRSVVQNVDTCDVYADETKSPEVILRTFEWLEEVRNAMNQLTERRRSVLVLNRMYGFTAKEIAMSMGIKVSTAKRLIYDATVDLEAVLNRQSMTEELCLLQQMSDVKE